MKLTIERNALLKTLGHVRSIVEKRTTIPILGNVVLMTSEGGLRFRATDLEREIVEETLADIAKAGATTVSAHTLYEIVSKMPDGAQVGLELDSEKERLSIVSGRSRFALQTLPAEDFPDLSQGEYSRRFEISAKDLRRLIDKTEFAMSTEETRYYLCGLFLHEAKQGAQPTLRAVATDGHRLAQAEVPLPEGAAGMPNIILPRKTIRELHRLFDKDSTIAMSVSERRAAFEIGNLTFTTKLIDGTYPDYQRVIPKGHGKRLEVENGPFVAAIDRVSTISSERGRGVKLNIEDGKVLFSVSNPEGGSATEAIEAVFGPAVSGGDNVAPMEIGFNAGYLLDIAGQIEAEKAEILFADPGSPAIIKDESDPGALYVLMPMRV